MSRVRPSNRDKTSPYEMYSFSSRITGKTGWIVPGAPVAHKPRPGKFIPRFFTEHSPKVFHMRSVLSATNLVILAGICIWSLEDAIPVRQHMAIINFTAEAVILIPLLQMLPGILKQYLPGVRDLRSGFDGTYFIYETSTFDLTR